MARSKAIDQEDDSRLRLDKWLWAARFFKTRALSHEAIELGRIEVGGERVKASRVVREGDVLDMKIQQLPWRVTVLQLSGQRRPAKEAQLMYSEDEAVKALREEKLLLNKAEHASFPHGDGRPTKRARREIDRFRGG
ncbi:RNA-binding S4 domain-containing protein [Craterilacuibacter sp.]|uniref:RNA-binding S4 domain-containing protein n=1 Tax=Craterilacuibacter sp. TaxID=2870909 RepID=UPI003F2C07AB